MYLEGGVSPLLPLNDDHSAKKKIRVQKGAWRKHNSELCKSGLCGTSHAFSLGLSEMWNWYWRPELFLFSSPPHLHMTPTAMVLYSGFVFLLQLISTPAIFNMFVQWYSFRLVGHMQTIPCFPLGWLLVTSALPEVVCGCEPRPSGWEGPEFDFFPQGKYFDHWEITRGGCNNMVNFYWWHQVCV